MKNAILFLSMSGIILLSSCGGNSGDQSANTSNTSKISGANLLSEEGPKYDVTAIDSAAPITTIVLRATGKSMAEMKYDQALIEVPAGNTIKLTFISEATDPSMPHNFLLINKNALDRIVQEGLKAGVDKEYIPEDEDIFVHTKLLKPGETDEITFPAPPAGEYKYVCTFPGHSLQMQGVFIVK